MNIPNAYLSVSSGIITDKDGNIIFIIQPTSLNSFIGFLSGNSTATGTENTGIGAFNCNDLITGNNNTTIGAFSGSALTNGNDNTLLGALSGSTLINGNMNTLLGGSSGRSLEFSKGNLFGGYLSGSSMTSGNDNIILGLNAASSMIGGNSNIIIGPNSYKNTTPLNNQLWIQNDDSDTPLIGGDFETKTLSITGDTTINGTLNIKNNILDENISTKGTLSFKHITFDQTDDNTPYTLTYPSSGPNNSQDALTFDKNGLGTFVPLNSKSGVANISINDGSLINSSTFYSQIETVVTLSVFANIENISTDTETINITITTIPMINITTHPVVIGNSVKKLNVDDYTDTSIMVSFELEEEISSETFNFQVTYLTF